MVVRMAVNPRRRRRRSRGTRKRGRRRRRRRNPVARRNPGLPMLQNVSLQDVAVAGASFMLVQKASEMAGQQGWPDVAVKGLAAVAIGMAVEAALPASKKAAVLAGMVPTALGALSLLTGGQYGMQTVGSAYVATGHRYRGQLRAGVPASAGVGI